MCCAQPLQHSHSVRGAWLHGLQFKAEGQEVLTITYLQEGSPAICLCVAVMTYGTDRVHWGCTITLNAHNLIKWSTSPLRPQQPWWIYPLSKLVSKSIWINNHNIHTGTPISLFWYLFSNPCCPRIQDTRWTSVVQPQQLHDSMSPTCAMLTPEKNNAIK